MNDNFEIILKTAQELADEYGNEGWTGDCNDFTQASSSISQELTNLEVERLAIFYLQLLAKLLKILLTFYVNIG